MRYNDGGITDLADAIKNKWPKLRLYNVAGTSSYDIVLDSVSTTSSQVILVYKLNTLEFNNEDINSSMLLDSSDVENSSETFSTISKDDLTEYRFTITINLIR